MVSKKQTTEVLSIIDPEWSWYFAYWRIRLLDRITSRIKTTIRTVM